MAKYLCRIAGLLVWCLWPCTLVAQGEAKAADPKSRAAIHHAAEFLIKAQAADGGWHSATYGQLKGGAALTTLVLASLAESPREVQAKYAAQIQRGYEFLQPGMAKRGTIACTDGSLDHPTYGAALWLSSRRKFAAGKLAFAGSREMQDAREDLVAYLLAAQVAEDRGFEKEDASFGGWDFLGQADASGITTGTNVSVTCLVLEALVAERNDLPLDVQKRIDVARQKAQGWLIHCQTTSGGFAFTPELQSLNNKAEYSDKGPRAYGTATCDGLRSLIATGLKPDDGPVKKAVAWLAERPALEIVPGFEGLPPELDWQRGLRFYYYSSLAKALPLLPQPEQAARRKALLKLLQSRQRVDGSFVNESDRMRENDPLIATALTLQALSAASSQR